MGEVIELRAGDYRARVDRTGAGLRALTWRGRDIVWPYGDQGPQAFQGQVLAPWPNRVRDGVYTFAGTEYRLEVNDPATDNAIHGLVHDLEWTPASVTDASATLRLAFAGTPGYPFPLDLALTYRLAEDGLTVTAAVRNTGAGPAPFGLGFHPYLTLGEPLSALADRGDLTVEVTADTRQPVDERLLPVGERVTLDGDAFDFRPPGRALGDTVLDTAYSSLDRDADGRAWVRVAGAGRRVSVWCDDGFDWLQTFTSDTLGGDDHRAYFAAEPMTCPANALATGDDLIVLAPGGASEHTFGITAEALTGG